MAMPDRRPTVPEPIGAHFVIQLSHERVLDALRPLTASLVFT
jgi:hypothetical protein